MTYLESLVKKYMELVESGDQFEAGKVMSIIVENGQFTEAMKIFNQLKK